MIKSGTGIRTENRRGDPMGRPELFRFVPTYLLRDRSTSLVPFSAIYVFFLTCPPSYSGLESN